MSTLKVSVARVCATLLLLVANASGQTPNPQPAKATKSVVNSVKFGSVKCLSIEEIFDTFNLKREQWQVVDGAIKGKGQLHRAKGDS